MVTPRSTATWPSSGCSSPVISRNRVLLPAPLGPTRPIFSPFWSAAEASMKRIWWPTCLETLSRRIICLTGNCDARLLFHAAQHWKPRNLPARPPCPAPCQCGLADNTDSDISPEIPVQTILLYLAALGAGISVATQQVLNGSLRTSLNSPSWAGFVSYLGGLATMVVVLLVMREPIPSWKLV